MKKNFLVIGLGEFGKSVAKTLYKNMVMSRITCEGVLSHEVSPIERPQVEKADISSKSTLIGSLSLSKYIIRIAIIII